MIKLALALCLTLGACASGESLEASIVQTWDRTSELDVYVPRLGHTYSVNAESYAAGRVDSDALTCLSDDLTDLANGDKYPTPVPEIMRVTRVGGCRDVADTVDAVKYVECWTLKGCETLHNWDSDWMTAHGFTF